MATVNFSVPDEVKAEFELSTTFNRVDGKRDDHDRRLHNLDLTSRASRTQQPLRS
jgi:hypothetical protein